LRKIFSHLLVARELVAVRKSRSVVDVCECHCFFLFSVKFVIANVRRYYYVTLYLSIVIFTFLRIIFSLIFAGVAGKLVEVERAVESLRVGLRIPLRPEGAQSPARFG
jgi:hypothetical protein